MWGTELVIETRLTRRAGAYNVSQIVPAFDKANMTLFADMSAFDYLVLAWCRVARPRVELTTFNLIWCEVYIKCESAFAFVYAQLECVKNQSQPRAFSQT